MLSSFHHCVEIKEFAAELILVGRTKPKTVVPMIVREFPAATGLDVVFALVSIADSMREWLPNDPFEETLTDKLFEACSMLGADLFAMEKLGIYPATCQAIEMFWGDEEGYFVLPK